MNTHRFTSYIINWLFSKSHDCKFQIFINLKIYSPFFFSSKYSGEIAIEFRDFRLDGVDLGQNADCLTSDYLVVEQKIRNLGWRQVRRYCGDWNPRLKAIHVVTQVSGLRIRAFLAPMHKNEEKPRGFVAKVRVEH